MINKCAKQSTLAVIINGSDIITGSNECLNPQRVCPRDGLPTGVGYEMCKNICKQIGHAEEVACLKAGYKAEGSILYLFGHTYCCDNCIKVMKEHKVKKVIIVSTGEEINL